MIYQLSGTGVSELTPNYVEYLYSDYVPDNSLIVLDGADVSGIETNSYSAIVYDCATNPIDPKLFRTPKPGHIISGLYTKPQGTKFFPFWAVYMSKTLESYSGLQRKFKISCLNGTPWNHRKLVYLSLHKKYYFQDLVFTFGNRSAHIELPTELKLSSEEVEQYIQLPNPVAYTPDDTTRGIDLSIDHPAYKETYVNLVTETRIDSATPMLSEKTFKPIIAGQLFVLVASPGAIEFLRSIGIDTFDDIVNHSYDQVEDTRVRIKLALAQLDRLARTDLNALYPKIEHRLRKNSDFFRSQTFRDQFKLNFG